MQSAYSIAPADWTTGHSFVESYPTAEMQSVYSTATADWTIGQSFLESYPSIEMQSVYSTAQAELVKFKSESVFYTVINTGNHV